MSVIGKVEWDSGQSALDVLIESERKNIVRKGIDQLTPDLSAIFLLYYYEDLSINEIAKITNLSKENIKIKLYRGRKKLFSILHNKLNNEIVSIDG